jgi:hypothetical protein
LYPAIPPTRDIPVTLPVLLQLLMMQEKFSPAIPPAKFEEPATLPVFLLLLIVQ